MSSARQPRGVRGAWLLTALAGLTWGGARVASAEPYLAVQQGYKCAACHVNPTGGGLRTAFGVVFAENVLPATTLPAGAPVWTGQIVQDILRLGGDLRTDWERAATPHSATQQQFTLEQFRLYADVSVIPDRLGLYVDEQVAPGAAQTMESYVRYGSTSSWYLKGGRFYLPFGWRLQDNSAFVRTVSGINMTTPDTGLELGMERASWSGQLDFTNGAANAQSGSGHQFTGQLVRVQSAWRIGAAASLTQSDAGNRRMFGLFAGLRTGPVAWLGEADLIRQEGFPEGARTMLPALGEANWTIRKGHNLKLTYEFYDPDRNVSHDEQTRWSAVYEFSPLPFLQLRGGYRRYQGIPQSDLQNRNLAFLELHAFL